MPRTKAKLLGGDFCGGAENWSARRKQTSIERKAKLGKKNFEKEKSVHPSSLAYIRV
jgi:hypothetical protein